MRHAVALMVGMAVTGTTVVAQGTTSTTLRTEALIARGDQEISLITVEYAPGATDPVHRHNAQVMVYVLEGSVVMQAQGKPAVTLGPGQTFYESPDEVHVVAKNASRTARAKFVVFFVKVKGAPNLVPVN